MTGSEDLAEARQAASTGPGPGIRDVLRIRPFAAYWIAGAASNIGTWIHRTVAMVLVWDLTHSPIAVGILAMGATAPILLFAIPAGWASDRYDRRQTIVVTHLVSAVAAGGLALQTALTGGSEIALVGTAFLLAACWAFAKPALSAFFPSLIPHEAMRAATAATSMYFIAGQVVGPVIGTVFVLAGQLPLAFAANALTFLIPAIVIGRLPGGPVRQADPRTSSGFGGFRLALTSPNVALLVVIAVAAGSGDVLRHLAPVVVDAVGAGSELTGFVITAVSIGSGAGAMTAGTIAGRLGEARGVMAGLAVEAGALLALLLRFEESTMLVSAAAMGVGLSWTFVILTSTLQSRTDDALRGRVMALHSLAHLGARPATTIATSILVGSAGVVIAILGNAAAVLAMLLLVGPSLARRRSPALAAELPPAAGDAG